jgi:hypothetical protein
LAHGNVRLVKDETETSYQVREFVSDLVDILVIFLALASLHFVSSLYSDDYERWPFFVAGGA